MNHDFKAQFRAQGIADRKRQTRKRNKERRRDAADYAEYLRRKDAKQRQANRKHICVSEGLIRCRKQQKLNQTDFANFLGISRRALVNYESGRRVVGGDVLEKILADGQIELHELFNLNPDPVPISTRLEIAELTVKLITACRDECPNVDTDKVLSLVPHVVAQWPKSRRTSRKNIEKAASKILDDIDEWEAAEEYWDEPQMLHINPDRCPTHPGELLCEDLIPATKKSRAEIARLLGISRQHLYDILAKRKPVSPEVSVRLGKLFGNDAGLWIRMQGAYDEWHATRTVDVSSIPTLTAAK